MAKRDGTAPPAGDEKPDAAADQMAKRDYSADDRTKMAKDGTAMPDGSFPIKDKEDLKAAVQAYGRAKNKAAAKRWITKRAKALGASDLLPTDWSGARAAKADDKAAANADEKKAEKGADGEPLAKAADLWNVGRMVSLLAQLEWAEEALEENPTMFAGTSLETSKELRDGFGAVLVQMGDLTAKLLDEVLASIRSEEAAEAMQMAAAASDLLKGGHTGGERLQKIHDHSVKMGAKCASGSAKAAGGEIDQDTFAKVAGENAGLRKVLDDLLPRVVGLAERLEKMENAPAPVPAPSILQVVDKNGDVLAKATSDLEELAKKDPDAAALTLISAAHQLPRRFFPGMGR